MTKEQSDKFTWGLVLSLVTGVLIIPASGVLIAAFLVIQFVVQEITCATDPSACFRWHLVGDSYWNKGLAIMLFVPLFIVWLKVARRLWNLYRK